MLSEVKLNVGFPAPRINAFMEKKLQVRWLIAYYNVVLNANVTYVN